MNVNVDLVLAPARTLSVPEATALANAISALKVKTVSLGPVARTATGASVPMVTPATDDAKGVAQIMAIVHGRALAIGLPVIRAIAQQV